MSKEIADKWTIFYIPQILDVPNTSDWRFWGFCNDDNLKQEIKFLEGQGYKYKAVEVNLPKIRK